MYCAIPSLDIQLSQSSLNECVCVGGQGLQARRPPPPQQPAARPLPSALARRPGMPYQGLPGPQQQGALGSQPGGPQQPRPAQPRPFFNASQVSLQFARNPLHPFSLCICTAPCQISLASVFGLLFRIAMVAMVAMMTHALASLSLTCKHGMAYDLTKHAFETFKP